MPHVGVKEAKHLALAGVEQDAVSVGLNPERQPVLRQVVANVIRHHRTHVLKNLAPTLPKHQVVAGRSPSSQRLRKPKSLRMLFENSVCRRVPRIWKPSSARQESQLSTTTAVQASPKMKW